MKFLGKLIKRKEVTVVVKEVFDTQYFFQTSFYKRMPYHQFLCCGYFKLFRLGEMCPFERYVLCCANGR